MTRPITPPTRVLWLARLDRRFQAWRERRARKRGLRPTVAAFPGYAGEDWVRVLGRVLIAPRTKSRQRGEYASVRGWRSFAAVPVAFGEVTITIDGATHTLQADQGGVIDTVLPARLSPGWQPITMSVEGSDPAETRVFVVANDVEFGVISDIDDTVMVTALPRPFLAAWNSFVLDEHARQAVPGMAVLLDRVVREHPGAPVIYLSTGAWNVAPTLGRFLRRHLFPSGALLLTDWGPTHDRLFRSGRAHKQENLRRLATEFPHVKWMLLGDDGQHDEALYTAFASEHPDRVAAVAIRELSVAEAVLAGGRSEADHTSASAPWVSGRDGSEILNRLIGLGVLPRQ